MSALSLQIMTISALLDLVRVAPGTTCQLSKNGNGDEKCLEDVSEACVHRHICKLVPARLRPHRAVMVGLERVLVRTGVEVDL